MTNVRAFVADIASAALSQKYNLVTLIGVLEYIPYYRSQDDPQRVCVELLARLRDNLADDGMLLIALENKLGEKYFSGCPEDHNGRLFSGITDYPQKSPITFSRNELKAMLEQAGFKKVVFYYLFPDYKLPKVVFRDGFDQSKMSGWLRGAFEDYTNGRQHFFSDALFVETLAKAGLAHHFSNSFMALCATSPSVCLETPWVIKKFWNGEQANPALHHTVSMVVEDGEPVILRETLERGKAHVDNEHTEYRLIPRDVCVNGNPLIVEALKATLAEDNYETLVNLLKDVLKNLVAAYGLGVVDPDGFDLVDGAAVDYCVWNLIRTVTGTFSFFDRKWKHKEPIPADYVLFRSLRGLYDEVHPFLAGQDLKGFVGKVLPAIVPTYEAPRYATYIALDTAFLHEVLAPGSVRGELKAAAARGTSGYLRDWLLPRGTRRRAFARQLWNLSKPRTPVIDHPSIPLPLQSSPHSLTALRR